MKKEALPPLQETMQAMEAAAADLYGFALVCLGGVAWVAEPEILDTLFLGLENMWFTAGDNNRISHHEFKDDFFKALWDRVKGKNVKTNPEDIPLGQEEMFFYKLPQVSRAILYLRSQKQFSLTSISAIIGLEIGVVREEMERGREFLLGRSIRAFDLAEEEF